MLNQKLAYDGWQQYGCTLLFEPIALQLVSESMTSETSYQGSLDEICSAQPSFIGFSKYV
jgi:hypothetical protein